MLSAVPFRADNVPFIMLFNATQQSITTELNKLDTLSSPVVFIHITDMDPSLLASVMRNHVSSLGLGLNCSCVRPYPGGPRSMFFPNNDCNYLWTIDSAVANYMNFCARQAAIFMINLTATLRDLISYVGDDSQTAPGPQVQRPKDDQQLQPAQHLSAQRQTYVEFIMLLQMAADKQRDELQMAEVVSHDKDDKVSPIHCFEDVSDFAPWVEEWILPDPTVLLGENDTCSSKTETRGSRTLENLPFGNTYFEGGNLALKKRKLDME